MDNPNKVVLSGYYGFDNIGDEAVLFAIISDLRAQMPNISITVLSNNPEKTAELYGVEAVNRWHIKEVSEALKACDMLISGGGSLLQDVTSSKTIPYYLGIVKIAQWYKKKVVFYSQGIGPIKHSYNKWLIKMIVNKVDAVFVRDNESHKVLKALGIKKPIVVAADPVLGIKSSEPVYKYVKNQLDNEKKAGVYLRSWKDDERLIASLEEALKYIIKEGYKVYLIPMYYQQDREIAIRLKERLGAEAEVVDKMLSIDEVVSYTAYFDFIIGMRLHSLIMAAAAKVPMIGLSYDPKVADFMKDMNIPFCINTDNLTAHELICKIQKLISSKETIKEQLDIMYNKQKEKINLPAEFIKAQFVLEGAMQDKIDILGAHIDNVTMDEAVSKISQFVNSTDKHMIFTPNPEIVMLAKNNEKLLSVMNKASLVVPDGIGVVIASKLKKGEKLKERVAGYDLVQNSMKQAVQKGYKYYFFGSKPTVAEEAAKQMRTKYPGIQIVGTHDGYFKEKDVPAIIEEINASGANVLLVALGAPKQEIWIDENKHFLKYVKVLIGVGGSFDVMAGNVKRAPEAFQKVGLEWFYRLLQEPTRIKRMMILPQFIIEVLRYKSKQNS